MATKTTATKKTKYMKLVSAKANFCKGKTTKAAVAKVAREYIADAAKKAEKKAAIGTKPKAKKKATVEAKRKANKVLKGACKMSASIGKKAKGKRRTVKAKAKRKTTKRK